MRGLKSFDVPKVTDDVRVALYTSAWIEISYLDTLRIQGLVALYTSAWIEINKDGKKDIWYYCRTLYECVD